MCGTAAIPSAKMERRFRKTTKFTPKKTGKNGQTSAFWTNLAHHKIESTGIVATKTHPS
jgi:hypothetical protein